MTPKSGKKCKKIAPSDPAAAQDADDADPGKVAEVKARERELKSGKYGRVKIKPFKPPESNEEEEPKSWIEIELLDDEGEPISGEPYEITLPDKRVAKGSLDGNGFARVDGIDPGSCQVTFPKLDGRSWERK